MKVLDILLVATVLNGCVFVQAESSIMKTTASDAISICKLASRGLDEGLVARVNATYETDKSHYAYLVSKGCGKNGVLNVGNLEPVSEESLKNFYKAGDRRCVEKGTPYICLITATIDAEVKITRDQDGEFWAELLKVHKFNFVESEDLGELHD